MNEIQILKAIIPELLNLENKSNRAIENILDRNHRSITMVVERKFGRERDYIKQLEDLHKMPIGPGIYFSGMSQIYIDKTIREDLLRKRDKYLNLIETILEEMKIERYNNTMEITDDIESKLIEEKVEDRLIRILTRFHRFVKQLKYRQGKSTIPIIEVENEYDIQDLLHALLKLEFDDVRAEEYTPSYAGSNSRIDFLLKKEEIIVEVKKTSEKLKDKEIGVQLNDDIAKYKTHPNSKVLYCFVYDPQELLSNPDGLENDLSIETEEFKVKIIITPKI